MWLEGSSMYPHLACRAGAQPTSVCKHQVQLGAVQLILAKEKLNNFNLL
jgi:hypothetical protein